MALEIERKFLLRRLPDLKYDYFKLINQCYVWSEEKQDYDRYRQSLFSDGRIEYLHTFKKRIKPGVQDEDEEEIPESLFFYHFFERNCDKFLKKKRYIFIKDGLKWEIDEFDGITLIIAEVELPEENYKLTIPKKVKKEIIMEVTNFPQFLNNNLAFKVKK